MQATKQQTPPAGDSIAEFNRRVQQLQAQGLTRSQAAVQVAKEDPELHARYLQACNPRGDVDTEARTKRTPAPAVAQFDALVQEEMKRTPDWRKAVAAVTRANPELHQRYIEATNPQAAGR